MASYCSGGAYSNHRLRSWVRDDFRCSARLHRHAQTAVDRPHESQDGSHHGKFPGSMGDLRLLDWLGEPHHLECYRGMREPSHGRVVSVLSSPRKGVVITADRGLDKQETDMRHIAVPLHLWRAR